MNTVALKLAHGGLGPPLPESLFPSILPPAYRSAISISHLSGSPFGHSAMTRTPATLFVGHCFHRPWPQHLYFTDGIAFPSLRSTPFSVSTTPACSSRQPAQSLIGCSDTYPWPPPSHCPPTLRHLIPLYTHNGSAPPCIALASVFRCRGSRSI